MARLEMHQSPRLRGVSRGRLLKISIPYLAALFWAGISYAQAPSAKDSRPANESDLAKENQSYVAASFADVENILRENPGLMIQLKRWVAQEATQQGRIVGEADLSDRAIEDRLREDTRFRATATELLERYGYLTPMIDPHSQLARENEALIEQRAKWLAREEETNRQPSRPAFTDSGSCDPQAEPQCAAEPQRTQPGGPAEDTSAPPSNPSIPIRAPERSGGELDTTAEREMPDESMANDLEFGEPLTPDAFGSASSQVRDQTSRGAGGAASPASFATDNSQKSSNGFDSEFPFEGPNFDSSARMDTRPETLASENPRESRPATAGSGWKGESERDREEEGERPGELDSRDMVPKPDPYSGVPSLVDMYMQTPPQSSVPQRFGAGIFRKGERGSQTIPMDLPVGPEYVVGPGDSLTIDLWGGVSRRLVRVVDREGRLSLPEVGPILVSGRSLGEVQQDVQQLLRSQFRDVSADVSLARLRTVRVYVVGDVRQPGAYDVSSLSTPLNALFLAGGPTERGSLRVAEHFRGKQLVEEVDLYALLLHGVKSGLARLEDGDSVLVPPIGSAVTVEGMVRRPGIYELRGEKNLAEVLQLAGGILPSAALDHIEVERLEDHSKRTMVSLSAAPGGDGDGVRKRLESFAVHDQDIIHLFPIAAYNEKAVYLEGHVLRPGRYAYHEGMKLTDILAGYTDLMPEPAAQYAEIIHLDPPAYAPRVEGFNLGETLSGHTPAPVLKSMDTIRIFGKYDFESVPTVSVWGEVREPGSYRVSGEIRVRDALHLAGGATPDALMDSAQIFRSLPDSTLKVFSVDLEKALSGDLDANIVLEPRDRIVVHRNPAKIDPPTVYVKGEIAKPGRYPLTAGMRISDLVQVGGGLRRSADPEIASLTQFHVADAEKVVADERAVNLEAALGKDPASDISLRDGDTLTIREISGWSDRGASITVRGEVQHAGTFGIQPGERLSSILARAGGFSAAAYPHGAVLERLDVREEEERSQRTMVVRVREEQQALNQLPENDNTQKAAKAAAMAQWQRILDSLTNNPPVGRLVIHINSNVRSWRNTTEDVPVRAGDVLIVPKTPDFVLVTGQVYNPTAIAFRPGKNAGWYLGQGGGPTNIADKKAIFVIRADGGVVNSEATASLWKGRPLSSTLQPGDTVVVPEKAVGRNISWQSVFLAGQVASSVATSVLVAVHY